MYLARFLHLFSAALWGVSQHHWVAPQQAVCRGESGRPHSCPAHSPLVGSGRPWCNPPTLSLFCVISLGIQELGYFIGFRAPWKDFQVFIFYTGRVHMPGFCLGWEQRSISETSWNPFTKRPAPVSKCLVWSAVKCLQSKGLCGLNKQFQNFLISSFSAHCLKPYFHRM